MGSLCDPRPLAHRRIDANPPPPYFGTFLCRDYIHRISVNFYLVPKFIYMIFLQNSTKIRCFQHTYKMGRPPINISVLLSSTQDSRFFRPLRFYSIRRLSEDMGISLRAARNAYHSGRTSIRKTSGKVYRLEWGKPVAPIDTSKCYYCRRDLTVKDRSTWFHME